MDKESYGNLGPYELRGELGRGAMACVWRAWDPSLQREVAIKEPLFDLNLPQDTLDEMGRRFVSEGRAAAKLNHPNIVTIHAADVYDGRPAIVMELIDGVSLANLLERGPLSPADAVSTIDQLLDAVGYAHKAGVVHRDIKSDNIFINTDGRVKLTDFGIAHLDDGSVTHATMVGTVLGTPGYMSPEQATGKPVDARSDLFSVGVVAYEMLAGSNPFGGHSADSTALLYRIVHEPAPELPEPIGQALPVDIRPAIMSALSKDPAYRPQSAEAFKAMLHGQAVHNASPAVVSTPLAATARQKKGGLPSWAPYAAIAGVAAIVLAVVFFAANSSGGISAPTGSISSNNIEPSSAATQEDEYFVGIHQGNVAIFMASRENEPYKILSVSVNDLSPQTAAIVGARVPMKTLEQAEEYAAILRKEAEANISSESATSGTHSNNESELSKGATTGSGGVMTIDRNGVVANMPANYKLTEIQDGLARWVSPDNTITITVTCLKNDRGLSIADQQAQVRRTYESQGYAIDNYAPIQDNWAIITGLRGSETVYSRSYVGSHYIKEICFTYQSGATGNSVVEQVSLNVNPGAL